MKERRSRPKTLEGERNLEEWKQAEGGRRSEESRCSRGGRAKGGEGRW